jgi:hypothetical protein
VDNTLSLAFHSADQSNYTTAIAANVGVTLAINIIKPSPLSLVSSPSTTHLPF